MDDEVLIDRLQEFAEELGKVPTSTEMDDEGPHTARTYQNHFGTWNAALKRAGLGVNKERGVSDEELLSDLQRLYDEKGYTPTGEDMDADGEYSKSTLIKRFGSWMAALERAGVDGEREPKIPRQDLLNELSRVAEREGREPRSSDIESGDGYSYPTYINRFGSWAAAVRAAGYEPFKQVGLSDEDYLNELRRLAPDEDTPPSSVKMRNEGKHTRSSYQRRFGSWNAAIRSAGFDPIRRSPGNSLKNAVYGEGWSEEKRKRVRERDGYECVICGISQSEYKEHYGMALDVHHIRPARDFEDGKERNKMSNLVTLCRACHMEYEGADLPNEYRPD